MDTNQEQEPGGFIPDALPSPAPTTASFSSSSSSSPLPHPRQHPLRAGSQKEEAARRYIEGKLLHISRRYTKKFQPQEEGDIVHGYESMREPAKDLGEVLDVLWLSGTPGLQVPYLLSIALTVTIYLPAFPPAPGATFGLLRKLDHAFSSLLKGEDIVTGERLPGFEFGKKAGFSKTDMVRCKSLVEATRVLVVEVMNKEPEPETEMEDETGHETDVSMGMESSIWDDDGHNMDVARVYEATIVQLGELLNGPDYDPGGST